MKNALFRLFCSAAALFNVIFAQTAQKGGSVLPGATHLSGVVTDSEGKPLADVWLHHTGLQGQIIKTNAEGRFEIQTRAPAIVFRKDGFKGRNYRIDRNATLEVKLDPAPQLKACPSSASCVSLKVFLSTFCLPRVRAVSVTAQVNDIDYGQRLFLIKTPGGRKGIQHAAGAMWGAGLPVDEDVWSAVEYRETDYRDPEGFLVIDARGKNSNGECWRVLGHAFETHQHRINFREGVEIANLPIARTGRLRARSRIGFPYPVTLRSDYGAVESAISSVRVTADAGANRILRCEFLIHIEPKAGIIRAIKIATTNLS